MAEATAIISDCNKANVAIYPVDVRGLATGMASPGKGQLEVTRVAPARQASPQATPASVFQTVAFPPTLPFAPQARGGGASGGTSGGGSRPVVSAPSSPTAPTRSNPSSDARRDQRE